LQLGKLTRNENGDVGIKWLDETGPNLVETNNLGIWRHCKNFIPFALIKMVLPSQITNLTRNANEEVGVNWINGFE
jgi:hypothetical protein